MYGGMGIKGLLCLEARACFSVHSGIRNKPDIQHSKSAIFVLLYSLHLHTKPCQGYEDRNEAFF